MLAQCLGYVHIDTGAMYRAVAWAAQEQQTPMTDGALQQVAQGLELRFAPGPDGKSRLFANGGEITEVIRQPHITALSSQVAAQPGVRRILVAKQRHMGHNGGVILDGRDIGTVVFPQAQIKFFLEASAAERGRRRHQDLLAAGAQDTLEATTTAMQERDNADRQRTCAPLQPAADAYHIDTTHMTAKQACEQMLAYIQQKRRAQQLPPLAVQEV